MDMDRGSIKRRRLFKQITGAAFGIAVLAGTVFQFHDKETSAAVVTYTVQDVTELRNAVTQSNISSDQNIIQIKPGTYNLGNTPLNITQPVVLIGSTGNVEASPSATQLIGSGNRILNINDGLGTFGDTSISALTISGGEAPDGDNIGGGGILADTGNGTLSLYNVVIANNATSTVGYGGGLYVSGPDAGALSLDRVTISGNSAAEHGGGLFVEGDMAVSIIRSTFESNHALSLSGGGLAFLPATTASAGPVTIRDSVFISNDAIGVNGQAVGGGMVISVPNTTIENTTFSGNKARDGGGGIIAASSGSPVLKHVTIANNTTTAGSGGGLLLNGGTPVIKSSVVSGNIASTGNADVAVGAGNTAKLNDTTSTNNVLEKATGVFTQVSPGGNNVIGVSANLLPLADNGGFTKTHALGVASPAYGAGGASGISYDQRGFPRLVASQTAAGAYEGYRDTVRYNTTYTKMFNFGGSTGVTATKKSESPSGLIASHTFSSSTLTVVPSTNKYGTANYEFSVNRTIAGVAQTLKGNFELEVIGLPDLTVTVSHSGNFYQTQKNAAYTITVKNQGVKPTSGTINLTDTLPAGMTLASFTGTNWNCAGLTCSSTASIPALGGTSTLTLLVDIADNAAASLTNSAAVSGGGEETADANNNTASDLTVVHPIPRVQSVAVPASQTYKAGDELSFMVVYDRNVDVTGTPTLPVQIGSQSKQAAFTGGSGTKEITFSYVVEQGLTDSDGVQLGTAIVLPNGTVMVSTDSAPAQLALSGAASTADVLVDSVIPELGSLQLPANGIYKAGAVLDFVASFNKNIVVTGSPTLSVTVGSSTVQAAYVANADPKKATFRYTVASGQNDADGIALNAIALQGGTVKDAAGNVAVLTLPAGLNTSGIQIDTQRPDLQSLSVPAAGAYKSGRALVFDVAYDEAVTVTGTPNIPISIGGVDRIAAYVSGSGTTSLRFSYSIQAGDNDADGIGFKDDQAVIALNGGTIRDAAGNDAVLQAASAPSMSGVIVDTAVPQITGVSIPSKTYLAGQSIPMTVQYNENVDVTGTPELSFNLGGSTVYATYQSGSGTPNLIFSYTLMNGQQDTDGIVLGTSVTLNTSTLKDQAGNDASLLLPGPAEYPDVKADAVIPEVTEVTAQDGYYTAGDTLSFNVKYSEAVDVVASGGTPTLSFTLGSQSFQADYASGSGNDTLVFSYTLQADEANGESAVIGAGSSVSLNGGTIKDVNGNPANLALIGVADLSGVKADSTLPALTSITVQAAGTYIAGNVLEFQVKTSEAVNVTGTPGLAFDLDHGTRTASYVPAASNATTLVFRYTAASGDMDANGIQLKASLELTGAGVKDAAGNGLDAELPAADTSGILIDTLIPETAEVTAPAAGSYLANNVLSFNLKLNKKVVVTTTGGTPALKLQIGTDEVYAAYTGDGSSSDTMTFAYTIASGNMDADGIELGGAIELRGGVVKDAAGNALALSLPATALPKIVVDTKAPDITAVTSVDGTYRAGDKLMFNVKFDETVQANTTGGKPYLAFKLGSTPFQADYESGSGTDTLSFTYTVKAGDANGETVDLAGTSAIELNGGTLQDPNGNAASLGLAGVSGMNGVKADSTAPSFTAIDIPASGIFKAGSHLDFTLTVSEDVGIDSTSGVASLSLQIGQEVHQAILISSDMLKHNLVFRYTVTAGDLDEDGIAFSVNQLQLNGAVVNDTAGNAAQPAIPTTDLSGIKVDTVVPVINAVDVPLTGSYREAQTLTYTLHVSKQVTVSGTPSLELQAGGTTVEAVYEGDATPTNTLTFEYTIANGVNDADGVELGALSLKGGSIRDHADNDIVLTLPPVTSPTTVKIDTDAPVKPGIATAENTKFQTAELALTGEAEAGTSVKVSVQSEPAGTEIDTQTVTAGPDGKWAATLHIETEGDYTLKAISTDTAGNASPEQTVHISVVPKLSFDAGSYQMVRGQTRPFLLQATYLDGTKKDVTNEAVFTIDQPSIAGIEGNRLKGLKTGTAVLKAEWSGLSITAPIKVTTPLTGGTVTDTIDLPVLLDHEGLAYSVKLDQIKAGELAIKLGNGEALELNLSKELLGKLLELNGDLKLSIQTGANAIQLSLPQLLEQVTNKLNGAAAGEIASLHIKIAPAAAEQSEAAAEALKQLGAKSAADPVNFSVQIEATNGQTYELDSFGEYVPRSIAAGSVKPANGAVAVRLDEATGELVFVPTTAFREENGVWVADIKDRSAGVYLILEDHVSFTDVKGHWAKSSIELLASMQVIKGKDADRFDPSGSITRAEFAALLTRVLAIGGETGDAKFSDVSQGWYADDVAAAAEAGIITGYADGTFRPNAVVSRQEIAVMIMRAVEFLGVAKGTEGGKTFADQDSIPSWAQEAVQQASALGLVKGNESGEFNPASLSTRAEAATMLLRMMQLAGISPW